MPAADDSDRALANAVGHALARAGITRASSLTLAYSGGVDSTVLLHLLAAARARLHFHLHAVHVHHGLQPAADAWPAHCRQTCAALHVPCTIERIHIDPHHPHGTQAAARTARHTALAARADDWLLLAHHLDDQAETLLYRLLRGSGPRGLAAMPALDPERRILRPLLGTRRAAIEAYARRHGLNWVEDPSNAHTHYARNHLRHAVLPALAPHFPDAAPALARAATHQQETARLLDQLAAIDLTHCGGEPLHLPRFLALPLERQANLLRHLYTRRHTLPPPSAQIHEILRQLATARLPALNWRTGGWLLTAQRHTLTLLPAPPDTSPAPHCWQLGETLIPWANGHIHIQPTPGHGLAARRILPLIEQGALHFTPRWPGLRIQTHPNGPAKTFKNLCQERRIPAPLRPYLPILHLGDQALWIAHLATAPDWRCPPKEDGLTLRLIPAAQP